MLDPQPRVRLAALLFKAGMPMLAKALSAAGKGAPRPEEKERLFARLEEAAWGFGPEVYEESDADDWEDAALARPEVRARLAAEVEAVARAR